MNLLLNAAISYAGLGYTVLPIKPNDKAPLTTHGLKDATTDVDVIEGWWLRWPNANVAIATTGLVVVDVDGTDNAWLKDEQRMHQLSSATVMATTPRGGRHYFYRQPQDKKWTNTIIADHVDTRANGGYVLAFPSTINGKKYKWAQGFTLEDEKPCLQLAPDWLIDLMDYRAKLGMQDIDSSENGLIPDGQRNSSLISYAGYMRRAGLSGDEMTPSIRLLNELRCRPPLPVSEVDRIINNAAAYEPDQITVAVVEHHREQDIDAANQDPNGGLSIIQLDTVKTKDIQHLWRDRIYLESINIIVGMPESGKSSLISDICARVSTGREWPDIPNIPQPVGRVLYIQCEDSIAATIKPRFENHNGDATKIDILCGVKVPRGEGIDTFALKEHMHHIDRYASKHPDLRLIVFDPLTAYLGKVDSHRDAEVRSVLNPLQAIAERYTIAILGIMHTNKSQMQAMYKVSGSMAFAAAARACWMIAKESMDEEESARLMLQVKNNLARNPGNWSYNLVNCENDRSRVEWLGRVEVSADEVLAITPGLGDNKLEEAIAWLLHILGDGPVSSLTIAVQSSEADIKERTLRRACAKLKTHRYKNDGKWYLCLKNEQN